MQYKLPTRVDVGNIRVEFESSYEPTGPFGVKSIGEVVINTPSPAIAAAVANATGVQIRNCRSLRRKSLKNCTNKVYGSNRIRNLQLTRNRGILKPVCVTHQSCAYCTVQQEELQ